MDIKFPAPPGGGHGRRIGRNGGVLCGGVDMESQRVVSSPGRLGNFTRIVGEIARRQRRVFTRLDHAGRVAGAGRSGGGEFPAIPGKGGRPQGDRPVRAARCSNVPEAGFHPGAEENRLLFPGKTGRGVQIDCITLRRSCDLLLLEVCPEGVIVLERGVKGRLLEPRMDGDAGRRPNSGAKAS